MDERVDCGHHGINDRECEKRGCCFKPSYGDKSKKTPWCFHQASMWLLLIILTRLCMVITRIQSTLFFFTTKLRTSVYMTLQGKRMTNFTGIPVNYRCNGKLPVISLSLFTLGASQ